MRKTRLYFGPRANKIRLWINKSGRATDGKEPESGHDAGGRAERGKEGLPGFHRRVY